MKYFVFPVLVHVVVYAAGRAGCRLVLSCHGGVWPPAALSSARAGCSAMADLGLPPRLAQLPYMGCDGYGGAQPAPTANWGAGSGHAYRGTAPPTLTWLA